MRVLFATYPEKTHLLAMVPLAWALRTAGHEVRIASAPGFAAEITQAGLTAVPVGSDRGLDRMLKLDHNWIVTGLDGLPVPYDTADWRPQDVTWEYLLEGYRLQVARWHRMSNVPLVADLVEYARAWRPDLVVWEPTTFAGSVAAAACGAAHVRLLFSVDTLGVTRDHFLRLRAGRPEGDREDPMAEWLGGYAAKYGFEFTEALVTGHHTIDLLPPSLRLEGDLSYLPLRYVPYGGAAVVPDWLREPPTRPRVVLTMGLSTASWAGYAMGFQEILDGLADLDIELVVALPATVHDQIERIPDNTRLVSYVPLHALAPTCSVIIHHAGFGTLSTAALNGVPQLIVPWDGDGPAMAKRVAAQGAGTAVHPGQTSAETIRDRLVALLTEPRYRLAAERLRQEVAAMPSPNDLVRRLELTVGGG
ncbi:activator-dependent family glycosyltransferase [Actinosynnema sp. NPDC047251]|uniref:Glycosyltransferase, family 1 n=1 Tax=Saccharothrix espanaensis (strain ATCC 51144 / DSM 44229 / JCM 9112 / NBRC 15066 / NRRL 15764) TaxID=1179773 RepID=K0K960_SACES|nr:activator-dependent family glycosyltransferase [Saccharothrix espanaensis]CCH33133.1 Glycosyltransferase, family 1 [Saccharothrix espanaensis DSM 44229]